MDEIGINSIDELHELSSALTQINNQLIEAREVHASVEMDIFKALSQIGGSEKLSRDNKIIVLLRNGKEYEAQRYIDSENIISKLSQAYKHAENMVNVKKHINNLLPK